MSIRLVVIGYGNPSRGDDALGPELVQRLQRHLDQHRELSDIEVIEDFQLQIEHSLDLVDRDLVLFMDASVSCKAPFAFTRLESREDSSYSTHALSPEAVLHVYLTTQATIPPPAYLLAVRGETWDLGHPLSETASKNLELAWDFLVRLIQEREPTTWAARAKEAPCTP